jgi:UDP-N-acetylglucosamine/UDP-N-acetylgalactosamine diphosphorylase
VLGHDLSSDRNYWDIGLEAIASGEVGVILLAGGQGTRLGVKYPKGMYKIGLPSQSSLFQLQAERLRRLQELAKRNFPTKPCRVRWYIMTSDATYEATRQCFMDNDYFGLGSKDQVVFFIQGKFPCFSFDGKILLEDRHRIAMAPDGNGGLYRALQSYGLLADMQTHDVRYLHVYCVDNVLVRVADPVFLGFCIKKQADCGNKVVEKKDPNEPVGVTCLRSGLGPTVVEYTELPDELADRRAVGGAATEDSGSKLAYRAANIANHFFTREFLQVVSLDHEASLLPHVARKKIPHISSDGRFFAPTLENGIKMEKFVFDVFRFSRNFVVWEVPREAEFSPLKNNDAKGKDCPRTCREDLYRLHARFVVDAGGKLELPSEDCTGANDGDMVPIVEVSPLRSYAGEGLETVSGKVFKPPMLLRTSHEETLKDSLSAPVPDNSSGATDVDKRSWFHIFV